MHCYRLLGSLQDAEDMVQECYLRAWKSHSQGAAVAAYRPWLYKIATNACLDLLRRRKRRALIQEELPLADARPKNPGIDEELWLEPFPDKLIPEIPAGPEAIYSMRESVSLAFMTALQQLSPQHRAVIILRDVLGWKAREVAEHLDMTVAAVNSATLRARQGLQKRSFRNESEPAVIDYFLENYVAAWEGRDIQRLVHLLKEDVVISMPPLPLWFAGVGPVTGFLADVPFHPQAADWRLAPVGINGQPGAAVYERPPGEQTYRFFGVHVLSVDAEGISRIDQFLGGHLPQLEQPLRPSWLPFFDLPAIINS